MKYDGFIIEEQAHFLQILEVVMIQAVLLLELGFRLELLLETIQQERKLLQCQNLDIFNIDSILLQMLLVFLLVLKILGLKQVSILILGPLI